jgi:hypothetical protein
MRNPVRSEEAAFRFLLFAIGYLALIAVGSAINTWLGLAVFLAELGATVALLLRARRKRS